MAIVDPYKDDWTCWADVARDFTGYVYGDEPPIAIPEPDEILLAGYQAGGYEGDAWVVFRNGDKYFEVSGSHCSCYGLEGQFDPEEYDDLDTFIRVIDARGVNYGVQGNYRALVLNELKSRL